MNATVNNAKECTLAERESGRPADVRIRDNITAAEVGVTRWRTNAGRPIVRMHCI